jgi:hypothetical protein
MNLRLVVPTHFSRPIPSCDRGCSHSSHSASCVSPASSSVSIEKLMANSPTTFRKIARKSTGNSSALPLKIVYAKSPSPNATNRTPTSRIACRHAFRRLTGEIRTLRSSRPNQLRNADFVALLLHPGLSTLGKSPVKCETCEHSHDNQTEERRVTRDHSG